MKIYSKEELNNYIYSLTYDDISLIPTKISQLKSRSDIKLESKFLGYKLTVPVLSSPMDTVTGIEMCRELTNLGAIGILNRFDSSLDSLLNNKVENEGIRAVSIGLDTPDSALEKLADRKYIICIDTANANNTYVLQKTEEIKKKFSVKIIVGNIAHGATLQTLVDSGVDAIRVGIGNGSVCTTSIQTGIGIGQVSSLLNVYYQREENKLDIRILADGGIKNAGDIAKAICLGADSVILGRMIAGTKETPGEVIKYNGQLWKKYRGSASFGVKLKNVFIEGEETMVPYKGAVKNVIDSISDGLRSCMSYMNCQTLDDLRNSDSFTLLSNNSFIERLPKV
jgi:IMP dehydrogenase